MSPGRPLAMHPLVTLAALALLGASLAACGSSDKKKSAELAAYETADIPIYDYQPPDVTDAKARVQIHDQLAPRVTVFNAAARWRAGELSRVRVPARAVAEVGDLSAQYRFTFYDAQGRPIDDGTGWSWKRMPPNEPVYFEGASLGGGAADWFLEVKPAGLFPYALGSDVPEDPRQRTPQTLRADFANEEVREKSVGGHGYLGPRLQEAPRKRPATGSPK